MDTVLVVVGFGLVIAGAAGQGPEAAGLGFAVGIVGAIIALFNK